MSNFVAKLVSPTALLYIFLGLSNIACGIYLTGHIEEPPGFTLINGASLFWIIAWWLLRDSRKRRVEWVYDIGMFLYIAWRLHALLVVEDQGRKRFACHLNFHRCVRWRTAGWNGTLYVACSSD